MSAGELTRADLFHKDSDAVMSACGKYRYWLHRRWRTGNGWAVFVMLNPSKADATKNDMTIAKCIGFAKSWGCEGIIVVNLFAYRTAYPRDLSMAKEDGIDVVGEENHSYVVLAMEMAEECFAELPKDHRYPGHLVCAWGSHKVADDQIPTTLGWLDGSLVGIKCLGKTRDGSPLHPSRIAYSSQLVDFDWRPRR